MSDEISLEEIGPEAEQVVTEKKLEGKKKLPAWLDLLEKLTAFDRNTDKFISKYKKRTTLFTTLFVVGIFLVFFSFVITGANLIVAAVVGAATIVALIFLILSRRQRKKYMAVDLTNDFRSVVLPLLRALSEDIESNKVNLKLDLRSHADKMKESGKEEVPPGRFRRVVQTTFDSPWCDLSTVLVDKNMINLSIGTQSTRIERYWSNPRGKSKYKQKWRQTTTVQTSLVPGVDVFAWNEEGIGEISESEKMKLSEKKGANVCRLTRKFTFKSVHNTPEESIKSNDVIGMFFELYRMLNPVRKEA